ncbi:MAG: exopolysaccharide biosynthesis polyprenyl glycosylphosphotransferase [Candidatus Nanoperiomorbaceae bacterium]
MKNRKSLTFTILLIVGDALAVLAAYSVAYIIRTRFNGAPITHFVPAAVYFKHLILLLPFILILFYAIGTYLSPQKFWARVGRLIFGAFGAMFFMIAISFFSFQPIFPAKMVPIYGLIFSLLFLALARAALYLIKYWRYRRNIGSEKVLLAGIAKSNLVTAQNLAHGITLRSSGYELIASIGDEKFAKNSYKSLTNFIRSGRFTPTIIIQIANRHTPEIDEDLLTFAQKNYAEFKFIPREFSDFTEKVEPELFASQQVFAVLPTPLLGWGRVAKRMFDLIMSGLFLVIFCWLYLIIWVLVKLFSGGGSALFSQNRLTRGDKKFRVYKFRTQYAKFDGTTPEQAFSMLGRPELAKKYRANGDQLDNDPRITPIGKFLRKTSLDELPQMWNVFCGDISLVGPRALVPEELAKYEKKYTILNVKSGITGLAVVNGRRDISFDERRRLDIYYVQNWSFELDLQILAKTIWSVLTQRGAQ